MKIKDSSMFVGGLSEPDKMPGYGFSIPAVRCLLGAILAKIANSTCGNCYALKGQYVVGVVKRALERRFQKIKKACTDGQEVYREKYISAFSDLLNAKLANYKKRKAAGKDIGHHSDVFRWHDSGDIQSVSHIELIAEICRRTPSIRHWIPTREYQILKTWLKDGGEIPINLCIRLSAHYIGQDPVNTAYLIGAGCTVSGVHRDHKIPEDTMSGFPWIECPAFKTTKDGKVDSALIGTPETGYCGSCRRCWNRRVPAVSYPYH